MIANCGVHRLPTPSIRSSRFGSAKVMRQFTASSAKITWTSSQNGVASLFWKKWFVSLFLIAVANNGITPTRLSAGKSTFQQLKSEREWPLADRFDISYRQQWKKSFAAKNFTWSNG